MRKIALFLTVIFGLQAWAQNQSQEALLLRYDSFFADQSYTENRQELLNIIQRCEKVGDDISKGNALRRLGILHSEIDQLDSALTYYLEALEIHHLTHYKSGVVSNLNCVAGLYVQMEQYPKALSYFLEAGELASELSQKDSSYSLLTSATLINAAQVYYYVDSMELAIKTLDRVLSIQKAFGNPEDGFALNLKALILYDQSDYHTALALFEEAGNQFLKFGNRIGFAQTLHNRALCYQEMKNWTLAERFFLESIDSALSLNSASLIAEIASNFEYYYLTRGDSIRAYHYGGMANRFKNSMLNEAGIKALIETEQKYSNEAKVREIKEQKQTLSRRFYYILALGVSLALAILLLILYRAHTRQKEKLVEAQLREQASKIDELFRKQELASLSAQMIGQNEERQRISRDLHDRLGGILSTIKLQFSHFEGKLSRLEQEFQSTFASLLGMIDTAYDEVRRISHDLSTGTLEKFGLKGAVKELIEAITEVSPIQIVFLDNKTDPALYEHLNEPLYRIIQELLSNTLKHAQASEISIQLHVNQGVLHFSYEDDGIGLQKKSKGRGIGMKNIESRVHVLQGTLSIDSTPGHGFTLMIEIPL
ncbi:MAG: sensor histidine kinase [Bacteroidota bacterium]|nr:sensor histidine kinase [Bacteroidota bacterium]MDX5431193.1 sensor histidine kinase [Bacteroidota bacterium]MDX5469932.1 sensor histidine kinase [Bacteroidota bacterium]